MTAVACGSAHRRCAPDRGTKRRRDVRDSLTVATCQFPVSGDVNRNGRYICDFIERAADRGADVVHFCETALSGYAGSCPEFDVPVFDVATFEGYDWQTLRKRTKP